MPKRRRPKLRFINQLTLRGLEPSTSLVIFDRRLKSKSPEFRQWLRHFPNQMAVTAGENLKSLDAFAKFAHRVHRNYGDRMARSWTVIAVGGGSVGDFAGFFASVYKRGVRLVHIPSTWLAALDSSHGGKTALNLAGAKNQIGTFYESSETWIARRLLDSQDQGGSTKRLDDAMGELAKIALIQGGTWAHRLRRPHRDGIATRRWMHLNLRAAIEAKLKIVDLDPLETKGVRYILNLGHTWGHVLEAEARLSHGLAVGQGLYFALDMSRELKRASLREIQTIEAWLVGLGIQRRSIAVKESRARRWLLRDKKKQRSQEITVLLPTRFGKIERTSISVETILRVARVNGWTKK